MVNTRLFVGNLPPAVTAKDLQKEFSSYGTVQNVDLKSKENLVDPTNPTFFAFITIDIDKSSINQCIQEFQQEQFRGRFLNVSVARESFLDRLKREREEAGHKTSTVPIQLPKCANTEESPAKKVVPKLLSKIESSSSEEYESEESNSDEDKTKIAEKSKDEILDDEDTLFIAKKRACTSLQNGRITIEKMTTSPLHVITKNQKDLKRLDGKAKQSDDKRKQSLHKMKDQYNQQKLAIQKALAAVETKQTNKIVFDDENGITGNPAKKKKLELFEDNNEEDNEDITNYGNDFEIKEQFQGKKGEKLMKLQSKFKSDSRFAMDSRFLEDDNNLENEIEEEEQENLNGDEERKWQLGILERIIGRPITAKKKKPEETNNLMIRYDPTCEDHSQYENITKTKASDENGDKEMPAHKNKGKKKKQNTKLREEKEAPVVSQDTFFKVNEDLGKSIKRPTEGFSLLSLFGRAEDVEDDAGLIDADNKEKFIPPTKIDNQSDNPFKYDSSDSEEENEIGKGKQNGKEAPGGRFTKTGVWIENFFLFDADPRFKEGLAFFRSPYSKNEDDDAADNYDKTKQKLKLIVTRKIAKDKKNYYRNTSKKNNKFKKKHK